MKKKNKPDDSPDAGSFQEYAKHIFEKMDRGWELPQPTDFEEDVIHQMAREYLIEILEENEKAPKGKKKSVETVNEMYLLLFKLNMLIHDPDEDGENEDGEEDNGDKDNVIKKENLFIK